MPIHSFRCEQGHVHDKLVKHDVKTSECPECQTTARLVFLTPPKIGWLQMATQKHVSPEFLDKFDKLHRDQKAKEEKCVKDHGDYGPLYGYQGPIGDGLPDE